MAGARGHPLLSFSTPVDSDGGLGTDTAAADLIACALGVAAPVVLDADAVRELEQFIVLAPLHQPHNLNGIKVLSERMPGVPQIACFDTAFHRTQPAVAQTYGLPRKITAEATISPLSSRLVSPVAIHRPSGETARGMVNFGMGDCRTRLPVAVSYSNN